MVVLTSDHGDYLGDHWLGEKDLYHDPSIRIPLIISDPSPEADTTRGLVHDHLVESIDSVLTFVESAGGLLSIRHLEGRSLLPLLHDSNPTLPWREFAISEIDFGSRGPVNALRCTPMTVVHGSSEPPPGNTCCIRNSATALQSCGRSDEIIDLGTDPSLSHIREQLHEQLFGWQRTLKVRTETVMDELMARGPQRNEEDFGILIGHW